MAPNQASKVFLATQTADEGRHLEVLVHRLFELGVDQPEKEIGKRGSPRLLEFKEVFLDLIRGEDWLVAVFAQNVILEWMEFAVYQLHATLADPRTREVLLGIVKDERRHIGFGENEVGRQLKRNPQATRRLAEIRRRLDPLVLRSFRDATHVLAIPPGKREDLGRSYLDAVERLGFA